jgi:hypothetical protein
VTAVLGCLRAVPAKVRDDPCDAALRNGRARVTLSLLLVGLTIALEPLPLTGYIVLLTTPNGKRLGLAFTLAWLLTLVAIVVLTLLLTGGHPPRQQTAPSTTALTIRVVLGFVLLLAALRQQRRRGIPRPDPAWMRRLDSVHASTAFALGFLLQPWPLVIAGAATVADADISQWQTVITLVVFCLLASSSYLAMQTYVTVAPDAARRSLNSLKSWLARNRDMIVIIVAVVVGLWLILYSGYVLVSQG